MILSFSPIVLIGEGQLDEGYSLFKFLLPAIPPDEAHRPSFAHA